jgi:Ca-activated chloride channel family protein
MRCTLTVLCLLLAAASVHARGLLIPKDKTIPPLAMSRHMVTVAIEEQAAVTRIEQTFRNHTERALEATYVFPVPRGSSVRGLSTWVNGREAKGELVEAGQARAIYTETVQRSLDPALLEYLDNDLFRLKVFPVPARGEVKVALSFTTALVRDAGVIEYLYPLRTDGKSTSTLEKFALDITLKSRHGVQNIYSPTHAIEVRRESDRDARIVFQKEQTLLDKDFQLLYTLGEKDVGVTLLPHRRAGAGKGHFMLLLSPRAELPKDHVQPRDLVLVLDVSGSMAGQPIVQAKNALKFVLDRLGPKDRFGLITFSDTVNQYGGGLWEGTADHVGRAKAWVDSIEAVGGTNINDALLAALELRPADAGRAFTVIFFTDGLPTIGVTDPAQIVKNVLARNTANTRIFTFGVGHEVNATLLDQLALRTRAASAYVRPTEDIEAKVSSLHAKIHYPVLVNLKLSVGKEVVLEEMQPPKLPDLFHGGQVMVLGKYTGHGQVKLTLEGTLGKEKKVYDYTVEFPEKTGGARDMVETIWARRKIGSLLDQVRAGGEQKELVESIVSLARKHGIATPYTSYLVVPESPLPVVGFGQPGSGNQTSAPASKGKSGSGGPFRTQMPVRQPPLPTGNFGPFLPAGVGGSSMMGGGGFGGGSFGGSGFGGGAGGGSGRMGGGSFSGGGFGTGTMGMSGSSPGRLNADGKRMPLIDWARKVQSRPDANKRGQPEQEHSTAAEKDAQQAKTALDKAGAALAKGQHAETQKGQLGVDLSVQLNQLRDQTRLTLNARRQAAGRTLLEVGGVWIDEGFEPKMKAKTVKAFSAAYFRLLERQPQLRELFRLGNYLVWVTPSGSALVIDRDDGREDLADAKIDELFKSVKR